MPDRRTDRKREDKARAKRLAVLYNLTVEDDAAILSEQGGVCAVSGRPEGKQRHAVDHCHKTGLIRGKLDHRINRGLSYFNDDPVLLRRAADYLENPPAVRALHGPRYGMIGKAKTGKRKTLYGSANGPQPHRDLSR